MKVLVFGSSGQVATALKPLFPEAHFLSRKDCDLSVPGQTFEAVSNHKPQWIINAAAYTQVDQAEKEPDTADQVNGLALKEIAEASQKIESRVIHISTDYVFNGENSEPYKEEDQTAPINKYGESKLLGERLLAQHLPNDHFIIRTSWVYDHSGKNFLNTMLRLFKEKEALNIVNDQIGASTYAPDIATVLSKVLHNPPSPGRYHFQSQGSTSWLGFAEEILSWCRSNSIPLEIKNLDGTSTENYPTPAKRPKYSVLNCEKIEKALGFKRPQWQSQVSKCLEERFGN